MAGQASILDDAEQQIVAMKRRIEQQHFRRGTRDVKFGPGGMVEVEFAVQAAQLRYGAGEARNEEDAVRLGEVVGPGVRSQSTVTALTGLTGPLPQHRDALLQMVDDYAFLVRVQARLRMANDGTGSVVGDDEAALEALGRRTGHQGEHAAESFRARLDDAMARNTATCAVLFGRER